jgi:hypothetical protein
MIVMTAINLRSIKPSIPALVSISDPDPDIEPNEENCILESNKSKENVNESDDSDAPLSKLIERASSVSQNSDRDTDGKCTDEPCVIVQKATVNESGRRIGKPHKCAFCSKMIVDKMARHLQAKHSEEIAVSRVLAYEKGSKERKKGWNTLLNKGDFSHNMM